MKHLTATPPILLQKPLDYISQSHRPLLILAWIPIWIRPSTVSVLGTLLSCGDGHRDFPSYLPLFSVSMHTGTNRIWNDDKRRIGAGLKIPGKWWPCNSPVQAFLSVKIRLNTVGRLWDLIVLPCDTFFFSFFPSFFFLSWTFYSQAKTPPSQQFHLQILTSTTHAQSHIYCCVTGREVRTFVFRTGDRCSNLSIFLRLSALCSISR